MNATRLLLAAAIALGTGIAGCTTAPVQDESAQYFDLPKGSRLVLNQDIEIPADSARAYVQHGRVLSFPKIDRYRAHCKFEMKRRLDTPQTIKPDTFVVTKMYREINRGTHSGAIMPVAIQLAGGGLSYELYATFFLLNSPTQPNVLGLTCQHLEDPVSPRYLSIQDIRMALGNVATLQLADDPRAVQ